MGWFDRVGCGCKGRVPVGMGHENGEVGVEGVHLVIGAFEPVLVQDLEGRR